jgi:hypothetical protein
MSAYNTHRARVGDIISVTVDGRDYQMTVWHISPPGTGATRYSAGPHIHAQIRPGGYGITFDYSNIERYSPKLLTPAPEGSHHVQD